MFSVYILYSKKYNKIYIGYTSDLFQRMLSHNFFSKKGYTYKYRPWLLVYYEDYNDKKLAMRREKSLKTSRGRSFAWEAVKRYLSQL